MIDRRKIVAGAVLAALLLLLYPFQTTIVPVWDLRVVDNQGARVAGINVTQHWQHNLLESVGHEELQRTDWEGRVIFPRRTIRAGFMYRAWSAVRKLLQEGGKARLNSYASVVVWGSEELQTNVAVYEGSGSPPHEIIVARPKILP